MRVSVVLLRRNGMRLRKGELAPALNGDLRISDAGNTSFKRPGLRAQLWGPTYGASDRPIGLPLFDPVVVDMGAESFSLSGIELCGADGRIREFVQVWRCEVFSGELKP